MRSLERTFCGGDEGVVGGTGTAAWRSVLLRTCPMLLFGDVTVRARGSVAAASAGGFVDAGRERGGVSCGRDGFGGGGSDGTLELSSLDVSPNDGVGVCICGRLLERAGGPWLGCGGGMSSSRSGSGVWRIIAPVSLSETSGTSSSTTGAPSSGSWPRPHAIS